MQKIEIEGIKALTQYQMARILRFAPSGHPYFDTTLPYHKVFTESFKAKGGMTPQISKQIGWEL
jgi:hypothetical protein